MLGSVERVDHPGALSDHTNLVGLEQGVGAGLGNNGLRSAYGEELTHHFHARLRLVGTDLGALVIFAYHVAAVCVDQVVPTILVVGGVHRHAVDLALGIVGDLLSGIVHVFPCPLVGRILYAVLVKDRLVVEQRDGVMILRQSEDLAVGTGVQVLDALIVLGQIDGAVLLDIAGQVEQNVVLHVHLSGVGVHPEYVGHGTAGSACLEQCPVVIPVNNLYVDLDAGSLGPLVSDFLDTLLLVGVPDVDGDGACLSAGVLFVGAGIGFRSAASDHQGCNHQDRE